MSEQIHQVAIVGGGVCGTALLYLLAEYSDVDNVVLIEKYDGVAKVNSHGRNNSQTLHCGDIETNYTLEKASKVKSAAEMIVNYTEKLANREQVIFKYPKMVIAVGESECQRLRERFVAFKKRAGIIVAALIASIGEKPAFTNSDNSSWALKPGTI